MHGLVLVTFLNCARSKAKGVVGRSLCPVEGEVCCATVICQCVKVAMLFVSVFFMLLFYLGIIVWTSWSGAWWCSTFVATSTASFPSSSTIDRNGCARSTSGTTSLASSPAAMPGSRCRCYCLASMCDGWLWLPCWFWYVYIKIVDLLMGLLRSLPLRSLLRLLRRLLRGLLGLAFEVWFACMTVVCWQFAVVSLFWLLDVYCVLLIQSLNKASQWTE